MHKIVERRCHSEKRKKWVYDIRSLDLSVLCNLASKTGMLVIQIVRVSIHCFYNCFLYFVVSSIFCVHIVSIFFFFKCFIFSELIRCCIDLHSCLFDVLKYSFFLFSCLAHKCVVIVFYLTLPCIPTNRKCPGRPKLGWTSQHCCLFR